MLTILPLDKPTEKLLEILNANAINEQNIEAALKLDLDMNGDFGECWLLLNFSEKTLYNVDINKESFSSTPISELSGTYIDSYTTSNRVLSHKKTTDSDEKHTVILGNCTNACKCKLLAFVTIWERLENGISVTEDDPIFEQFNAKCPKCGRVYENQQRRICTHCINKKGTIVRMLSYFKPFKANLAVVLVCMLASSVISLLSPILNGKLLFDQVMG